MSDAYVIVQHGANTFIGGTSAACPVVAGLISLLNSERMAAGALCGRYFMCKIPLSSADVSDAFE